MWRALRISMVQALRSIILILLPISFISLITWATAGSTSGNTADPIRAGLWIFLAAHQIPLQLAVDGENSLGSLTFLPLGALAIPFIAIRSGFRRTIALSNVTSANERRNLLIAFAISYSAISYLFAIPALGKTVTVPFYLAIPILFIIAFGFALITGSFLGNAENGRNWEISLRIALMAISALVGSGSLLLAASLIWHFEVVVNLTRVVEPGIFGGVSLLLLQLLYLPNFAIAAMSYLSGAGFTISSGSAISPFIHRIEEIPAIPILGALPSQRIPQFAAAIILIFALGALVAQLSIANRPLALSIAFISLLSLVIARAASGELISINLESIGAIWWLMPPLITLEIALGALLAIQIRSWRISRGGRDG